MTTHSMKRLNMWDQLFPIYLAIIFSFFACSQEEVQPTTDAHLLSNTYTLSGLDASVNFAQEARIDGETRQFTIKTKTFGNLHFDLKHDAGFKIGNKKCLFIGQANVARASMLVAKNGFILKFEIDNVPYSIRKMAPLNYGVSTIQDDAQQLYQDLQSGRVSQVALKKAGGDMRMIEQFVNQPTSMAYTATDIVEKGIDYKLIKQKSALVNQAKKFHNQACVGGDENRVNTLETAINQKVSNSCDETFILEFFYSDAPIDELAEAVYMSIKDVIGDFRFTPRNFNLHDTKTYARNPASYIPLLVDYIATVTQVTPHVDQLVGRQLAMVDFYRRHNAEGRTSSAACGFGLYEQNVIKCGLFGATVGTIAPAMAAGQYGEFATSEVNYPGGFTTLTGFTVTNIGIAKLTLAHEVGHTIINANHRRCNGQIEHSCDPISVDVMNGIVNQNRSIYHVDPEFRSSITTILNGAR